MPMDLANIEQEMDTVEKYGAGRITQEMAKNPVTPGTHTADPYPQGRPAELVEYKRQKTLNTVGTRVTFVSRRESDVKDSSESEGENSSNLYQETEETESKIDEENTESATPPMN